MAVAFRISALPMELFTDLFRLTDEELARRGGRRVVAASKPGYPCRVSLQDADVGERLLLLPFTHQPVDSPYRSTGPIYVRENARQAELAVGEVPDLLRRRLLSVRSYDAAGMMTDAAVVEGRDLETVVDRMLGDEKTEYLHVHNAKPGCFNCRIDRA
jgi:hypothetical protein